MNKLKRIISILVCAAYILVSMLFGAPAGLFAPIAALVPIAALAPIAAFAATASAPPAIGGLSANPAGIVLDNARKRTDATFTHDAPAAAPPPLPADPVQNDARYTARTVKYYLEEHNKGYRGKQPARTVEDRRDADFKPDGPFTIPNLPTGIIYDVYATDYTTFEEYPKVGTGQRTTGVSPESAPSNQVLLFTGVQLDAQLIAFDQVRLIWDDVWYNDRRIYGYTLNIYTSGDVSSRVLQASIPLYQSQIGQAGSITPNEATGKLEYTYNVPYAGRVYSFEIVPVLNDIPGIIAPERNGVVTIASRIAVAATKLFEDPVEDRITWDISWSNVTAGMGNDRRYTAVYTLSKMGGGATYQVLQVINNLTSTIHVTPRDPNDPENMNALYEITAIIYADGEELYVGADMVSISSGPFTLKESETPYTPQAPVLLLEEIIPPAAPAPAPDGARAALWWNIPRQASDPDKNDLEVSYEIFVLNDPKDIDTLSDINTAQNITPDFSEDGARLQQGMSAVGSEIGYVYNVAGLAPNTTYYIAVRAVKAFVDVVDMSYIKRYSQIAYVTFTTPPSGPIGQPPAPTAFELIKESVTARSAEFNIMTAWYEQLEKVGSEPWEWVWQPGFDPGADPLPPDYRKLTYEAGDQIYLYYAEYEQGMDADKPETLPTGNYLVATITDVGGNNSVLRIPVAGLKPNTIYIFWARAARPGQLMSHPSKTILLTTPPEPNTGLVTPVTPEFEIMFIGDTYVDLIWQKLQDYTYDIQYSRVDDFGGTNATTITTSTADITASGVDFFRVTGLTPDTLYYFRIRAEISSALTGETKTSAWSDSKPARTKPPMPPATPSGFGIKPGAGAITKDSIDYEWLQLPGLIYILEYTRDASMMDNAVEIIVGMVKEYKLTGLLSNHHYYARLYAFDPATGLRSDPTYIVGAKTYRSDVDYDANVDITMPLIGEFVKIDTLAIEGVWNISILGTDADRLVERILTDTYVDYSIDLSKPPRHTHTIRITSEGKVFEGLDTIKANLIIVLPDKSFILRPRMLSPSYAASPAARRVNAYKYEILIGLEGGFGYVKPGGMSLKTAPSGFEANILDGGVRYPITDKFGKGLLVAVPFTGVSWYTAGVTQGVYVSPDGVWQRLAAAVEFNPDTRLGQITFEFNRPGTFFAADIGGRGMFTDVSGAYAEYVNRLGALGYTDARAGSAFRPNDPVTPAEAAGMLYRAMGYATGGTGNAADAPGAAARNDEAYINAAYKAGFIADAGQMDLKIEEALALVARAYAVRAGVRVQLAPAATAGTAGTTGAGSGASTGASAGAGTAADAGNSQQPYAPGLANAPEPIRSYAQFALDNGLAAPVIPNPSSSFPAGRPTTRAEITVFICQALELLGEI